jgi:hypothetical protein
MDRLIKELRGLLDELRKVDPKLHSRMINVVKRAQREYVKSYGVPGFMGWIDPW